MPIDVRPSVRPPNARFLLEESASRLKSGSSLRRSG